MMALNSNGKKVWSQTLDIFGRNSEKSTNFVPFRYQGQYYDEETGLSYNRFRYYDDSTGQYISQDPIGLAGGNPTIYGYVKNTNRKFDIYGLNSTTLNHNLGGTVGDEMQAHHIIPEEVWSENQTFFDGLGLERDAATNGILLPDKVENIKPDGPQVVHRGSHPQYSDEIRAKVTSISDALENNLIDDIQAKNAIEDLQTEYHKKLEDGDVPKINNKLH